MTALAVSVGVGAVGIDRVALQPAVAITPQGIQLTTPWRAVTGATGARVGSAVLTVDPVTHGPGRDVGTVAPGGDAVQNITVRPPNPAVPTRGLTVPGLHTTLTGNPALRVVVQQAASRSSPSPRCPATASSCPRSSPGGPGPGRSSRSPTCSGR